MKLEGIFAPQTRELRDKKFISDNGPNAPSESARIFFAHYTSAEAAIKILRSKRPWMRSTTCMVDFSEVEFGYRILQNYFRQQDKKNALLNAVNAIEENSGDQAVTAFDRLWNQLRFDTYISCFSEHDAREEGDIGRLSMWRAFASSSPRVALVFSVPWQANVPAALGVFVSPCAYLKSHRSATLLDEVVANVEKERDFLRSLPKGTIAEWMLQSLMTIAACTKHYGFQEEREWRVIHAPVFGVPTQVVRSKETVFQGVPQTIFEIPFDGAVSPALAHLDLSVLLDRVIIGPTQFANAIWKALVEALVACGVQDPETKIRYSDIPIRS